MSTITEKAAENLAAVRTRKPLIHNITNFVVMNFTANTLLAMVAEPTDENLVTRPIIIIFS